MSITLYRNEQLSGKFYLKLPEDSIIPVSKLNDYLLLPRERNDKSKLLASIGFVRDNWKDLDLAIRKIITHNVAVFSEDTKYGRVYSVSGVLEGSSGNVDVTTFWIERLDTGKTQFITLVPTKRR